MFLLTEVTLFFTNVLTTASSDDKATLCKHVNAWMNVMDASSTRSSSVSASLRTLTAPPPPSTSATSTSGIEASASHLDTQLPVNDLNNPYSRFKSQLPEGWKWPAFQLRIPENEGGEIDKPAGPIVMDIHTLENSQCAAAMSKDCEADNAATELVNIKRKAAKLEYISSSEVELDDGTYNDHNHIGNAIHVPEHKGAVKPSIMVTKTVPKKIKMEGSHVMEAISAQAHLNNMDLPSGLHKDQKWRREVIPTLILWAGNQDNAFNITKQDVCHALWEIISVVYPTLKNTSSTILLNSPMVAVATVAQLTTFFLNPHDPSPKATAQLLLDQFTFLYEDLDATSPEKAFHSVFVQQLLLGSHLSATKGYVQVSTLHMSSLVKHGVVGALGLCGAAVPVNAKDGIVKLATRDVQTPIRFNMALGKDSKTACAFSDQNWGTPMRKFTNAAQRRSTTQLQGIVELTLALLMIGQEPNPNALSNVGSDDKFALIYNELSIQVRSK
ncbi:hypothetical protein EDC04DRAFT_2601668 [Pisolithus marmoratus]|nr:hypothetical protein EDC04DRAFT_2601668 [Pisolithus marmoratus]